MSDKDLRELHAQGASAFQAGAWEVLDDELRRRERVRRRLGTTPHAEEERYPALRTTVVLLKVISVLVLLVAVGAGFALFATSPLVGLAAIVAGLLSAITYWAAADLFVVLMDIEANTRAMRHEQE